MHKSRHRNRFTNNHNSNSSSLSQFSTNKLFSSTFINSVANIQPTGIIDTSSDVSQLEIHKNNSSILATLKENYEKRKKKNVEDLDLDELISKFISKDTQSII